MIVEKDNISNYSAKNIYEELTQDNTPVTLKKLLDFSWSVNIPVLFMPFNPGGKKTEGISIKHKGSYTIILSYNHKFPSKQLFILAHELAHIILGHVEEGNVLVDSCEESSFQNKIELEADALGIEIVTSCSEFNGYNLIKKYDDNFFNNWIDSDKMKSVIDDISKKQIISPGFIAWTSALEFSKISDDKKLPNVLFSIVTKILHSLEDNEDAIQIIRNTMFNNLDINKLDDDSKQFLLKVCYE